MLSCCLNTRLQLKECDGWQEQALRGVAGVPFEHRSMRSRLTQLGDHIRVQQKH